eukprot:TRINITY_DN2169_c0_g3_i4.p1 TRINITY_DN2169_c0_g3~~TRINITY_DN2169_c0_g3_i4.p1  ORF type:complete len:140 (+),score=9.87 TRINITY_DN2169_c0_g3_i4:85-504(+)
MSTCTRRLMATLEEKNVSYEVVTVDLQKGEHKQPAHLARQPFGQIPAFEDGDVKMFETRAIVRYIANKWATQGTELLGKSAAEKALTDTWVEVRLFPTTLRMKQSKLQGCQCGEPKLQPSNQRDSRTKSVQGHAWKTVG